MREVVDSVVAQVCAFDTRLRELDARLEKAIALVLEENDARIKGRSYLCARMDKLEANLQLSNQADVVVQLDSFGSRLKEVEDRLSMAADLETFGSRLKEIDKALSAVKAVLSEARVAGSVENAMDAKRSCDEAAERGAGENVMVAKRCLEVAAEQLVERKFQQQELGDFPQHVERLKTIQCQSDSLEPSPDVKHQPRQHQHKIRQEPGDSEQQRQVLTAGRWRHLSWLHLYDFDLLSPKVSAKEVKEYVDQGRAMRPRHSYMSIALSCVVMICLLVLFVYPEVEVFLAAVPSHVTRTGVMVDGGNTLPMPYTWFEVELEVQAIHNASGMSKLFRLDVHHSIEDGINKTTRSLGYAIGDCPRAKALRNASHNNTPRIFMCMPDDGMVMLASGSDQFVRQTVQAAFVLPCLQSGNRCPKGLEAVKWHLHYCSVPTHAEFVGHPSTILRPGSPRCYNYTFRHNDAAKLAFVIQKDVAEVNDRFNPYTKRKIEWASRHGLEAGMSQTDTEVPEKAKMLIVLDPEYDLHYIEYPTLMNMLANIGGGWGSLVSTFAIINLGYMVLVSKA